MSLSKLEQIFKGLGKKISKYLLSNFYLLTMLSQREMGNCSWDRTLILDRSHCEFQSVLKWDSLPDILFLFCKIKTLIYDYPTELVSRLNKECRECMGHSFDSVHAPFLSECNFDIINYSVKAMCFSFIFIVMF